ncbi:glycosyltransferase family 2 protein [Mycobacterium sp. PS03-16]|uniref:glycosyltransferase family 2 protein n=1 Tax=Mycobacterium sp. PS03-16 TaxID=2559611 RepID=UPI001FD7C91E|nr:glycosyltransferase family 2 protein [Mycobacterium sp. PS03-16]
MLAFITTLRHPRNSADYGRVEALLADTLASITRQTCDHYAVLIVGNRRPSFALPDRAHFVEVDFPPPTAHRGPQTGMAPFVWDKGTKVGVGLVAARVLGARYAMLVDADDFVHRELAAFARAHPASPGWVVKRGFMYSRARNAYAPRFRLFRICGTSFILPLDAYEVPADLAVTASQHQIADAFGDKLERVLADHRHALEWWKDRGRVLRPLPFAGSVYQVDTGENHSGNFLLGPGMPYRSHLARDFGIRSSKKPASTVWSSVGPAALKPDMRLPRPGFLRPKTSFLDGYQPPAEDRESA